MASLIFPTCRKWAFISVFLCGVSFGTGCYVTRVNVETEVSAAVVIRPYIFRVAMLYEVQKIRKC